MSFPQWSCFFLGLVLIASGPVRAGVTDQEAKLEEVLNVLTGSSLEGIPVGLLESAQGIAIIPSVVKVGLVVGGRYGKGLLSVRRPTGEWSRPLFISLSGGNVGWQLGAQSVDVVLLLPSRRLVDVLVASGLAMGGDALVVPGVTVEADPEEPQEEIYTYSIGPGPVAGIDLKGTRLQVEKDDNHGYYQQQLKSEQVLDDDTVNLPDSAIRLKTLLKEMTGMKP
ncbi:MAG: lipid-binding SYLF domain-containing protein [Gammaproteobacteria bacterium]|nr:lipid-binding SYLF domain-containing protein [Gammaproteobacteria bacterium]